MSTGRPLLLTATAPTPNGALHLGHLSGPYLAADIAARAARARGQRVLTVGGVDPHQNYVVAKAERLGRLPAEVADEYAGLVRQAWERARISYDIFVDPAHDAAYRSGVRALLTALVDGKAVELTETTLHRCAWCGRSSHHAYVSGGCPTCGSPSGGGTCEGCGSFLLAGDLTDPVCVCGGHPEEFRATVPVLSLERYRSRLTEAWSAAVLGPRVRDLIGRYLDRGLPDVPLAYPTDWGIAADGSPSAGSPAELRIDVWAEMGLGYLHTVARHLDPAAEGLDGYRRAWDGAGPVWNFLGVDNAFYYAVLFPALAAAAEIPGYRLGGMHVNEFYRLAGAKFSTSRDHAVWAHEFLAGQDAGLVRLYLSWDRPDRSETDFTLGGYAAFTGHLGTGEPVGALPGVLVDQELARAAEALRLSGFDPAAAVRCLHHVATQRPDAARPILELIAGGPLRATGR
jgi:methionyl-tRNA synthetase